MQVPKPDVQETLAQFLLRVVWESSHLFERTSSAFSVPSGCFLEMPTDRGQDGSKAAAAGESTVAAGFLCLIAVGSLGVLV